MNVLLTQFVDIVDELQPVLTSFFWQEASKEHENIIKHAFDTQSEITHAFLQQIRIPCASGTIEMHKKISEEYLQIPHRQKQFIALLEYKL